MNLLILTCSITPNAQPDLAISDPEVRLHDYVTALKLWNENTKKTETRIWVLENTNSIAKLKEALSDIEIDLEKFRFFQVPLDVNSRIFGKSAGEYEMLKTIKDEQALKSFDLITKVTGRLYVKNFEKCLTFLDSFDFACGRFYFPSHILDSRFFCITPAVYELIFQDNVKFSARISYDENIGGGTYLSMEHYLAYRALELESMGFSVKSFPSAPLYFGQSASTGKKLNSASVEAKIRISNYVRRVAIKFLSGYTP